MTDSSSVASSESDAPTIATASGTNAGVRDEPLLQGASVGRYLVLRMLGSGGMGAVYAAYDPELDRNVALKVLHASASASAAEERTRLLREARATAKLNHPNVVTVHDVGEHHGRVFLAMELVEGLTLRHFVSHGERPWVELVDVFCRAGEGLAAAHAEGLVHRDFKPDNVIVGLTDGDPDAPIRCVRVLDFGLARSSVGIAPTQDRTLASLEEVQFDEHTSLMLEGAVVGTPAYMSPEQMWGRRALPRSDQFSFCVALYEALYGERPFRGRSLGEMAMNISEGTMRPPPGATAVPSFVRRALLRGLDVEPERRFPSVRALLAALRRDPRRRRRRVAVGAAVGVSIAAVGGVGAYRAHQRAADCDAQGESMLARWDDADAASIKAAMHGTGATDADVAFARVQPRIAGYVERWAELRTQACRATRVDEERSESLLDRSYACLDERKNALEARLERLASPTKTAVRSAVKSVLALPRLEPCLDEQYLALLEPPPDDEASVEQADAIRAMLQRVDAHASLGEYEDAVARARATCAAADALAWPPLVARARVALGEALALDGQYVAARDELTEGYLNAHQAGSDALAADAAMELTSLVGYDLAEHDEGRWWGRLAGATLRRLGAGGTLDEALLLESLAAIDYGSGDFAAARPRLERCLQIRETQLGPDHPDVARAVGRLAILHESASEYDTAEALYQRALAIDEAAFGPGHPSVAADMVNLGLLYSLISRPTDAKDLFERAIAIDEVALGPDHPALAQDLSNLAMLLAATGEGPRARELSARALAIREAALGPEHPDVGAELNNLGKMHAAAGDMDQAVSLFERALAIKAKTLKPPHPSLAQAHRNLGVALAARGQYKRAVSLAEQALAMNLEGFGADHPETAISRFELARVLWDSELDRDRARELVAAARTTFVAVGDGARGELAELDAWLEAR